MATITADHTVRLDATARRLDNPAFQAFALLRIGFTVAPILFGIDKFLDWVVDWRIHLLPQADYYDVALRDFGLLLAALTLARLATAFDRPARARA